MMKIKVFGIITVLLFMCKFIECDNMQPQQQPLFCSDLRPQNDIDIEKVSVYTIVTFLVCILNCVFFSFCFSQLFISCSEYGMEMI